MCNGWLALVLHVTFVKVDTYAFARSVPVKPTTVDARDQRACMEGATVSGTDEQEVVVVDEIDLEVQEIETRVAAIDAPPDPGSY